MLCRQNFIMKHIFMKQIRIDIKEDITMTAYLRDRNSRRWILGDTILNLVLAMYLFKYGMDGMIADGGDFGIYAVVNIISMFLWALVVADIIYWVQYLRRGYTGISVIIDTICKWSVGLKMVLLVCAAATAVAVGFHIVFNGGYI